MALGFVTVMSVLWETPEENSETTVFSISLHSTITFFWLFNFSFWFFEGAAKFQSFYTLIFFFFYSPIN